ncbi:MAG TPA: peptidoglycan DD-metalloendopeptidase family protein, partial [Crenalkalicoccus sp.]|nr:peptidoglycan DD-metalloendopeptidase family protein [Crenalkalicoccus sp.]
SPAAGGHARPVVGTLVRTFGAPAEAGPAQGLTFQAAPGARVVSPCRGRVAFAGPFRSFGELLILDCGGGEHAVLTGLGRLDAASGQRVLAGEPIGVLPDTPGPAHLYLELRRNGEAVDPRPWLAGRD